jgi:TolB-like protein
MVRLTTTLISIFLLQGCTLLDDGQYIFIKKTDQVAAETTTEVAPQPDILLIPKNTNQYKASYIHKDISDYAEALTMQLIASGQHLRSQDRIGVASFVNFDQSLQNVTPTGNQLAESFIVQLQSYGLSVVDFKTVGDIRVSHRGDFVFSRKAEQLSFRQGIDYVLSGTLRDNGRGLVVNARIIGMKDKVVIASANGFIPSVVVEAAVPDYIQVVN